jgi:hypothetical protein
MFIFLISVGGFNDIVWVCVENKNLFTSAEHNNNNSELKKLMLYSILPSVGCVCSLVFLLSIQCLMYLILLNVHQIVSILFSDLFKYLQNVLINGIFLTQLSHWITSYNTYENNESSCSCRQRGLNVETSPCHRIFFHRLFIFDINSFQDESNFISNSLFFRC